MDKIYYNINHPAGFSSAHKLRKALFSKFSKNDIDEWLQNQDTFTLHKSVRKKFPMNKYFVTNIDDLFQADLVDLKSLNSYNDGYQYLLTVIDTFSKFAWVKPLKSKTTRDVSDAFENIFNYSDRVPLNIETDSGKEFTGRFIKKNVWNKYNINHFIARNPTVKACIVERFNRTLKTKMFKYFTHANTYRYLDVLDNLVDAYNSSIHRTIKMAPKDVTPYKVLEVYTNTHRNDIKTRKNPKYQVGDYVRISKYKHVFEKGYDENWTREIFKIVQVVKRQPVVYKLCDLTDETIEGVFYEPEIQKVIYNNESIFKIDKILKKRIRNGIHELYVSWKGYPAKFNSWVGEKEITSI